MNVEPHTDVASITVVRRPPDSKIRHAGRLDDPASRTRNRSAIISLALGAPSWPLHPVARRALASIRHAAYGDHAGDVGLRRAIAVHEDVDPETVLVTAGAQGALFSLTQAFLGPGDVALVPDPGFPGYRTLTQLAGAEAKAYALGPDFTLAADRLIARIESIPRLKMVFVNHPSNPTGAGATEPSLIRVARACSARGVLLVADEVYRHLRLGPAAPSLCALTDPSVADTAVVVSSVSKAWGAPGLRVGWMIGHPRWLRPCRALHATMTTSTAGPSQRAARALIESSDRVLPASHRALRRRWRALVDTWRDVTGVVPDAPSGGLYLWLDVGHDAGFVHRARARGVAVVPGHVFGDGGRGFVRVAFGGTPRSIEVGVRRLLSKEERP